jgi:hypothetical protein
VSLRRGLAKLLDIGKRRAAVNMRLARAEEIKVRTVKNVDGFAHGHASRLLSAGRTSRTRPVIGKALTKGKRDRAEMPFDLDP